MSAKENPKNEPAKPDQAAAGKKPKYRAGSRNNTVRQHAEALCEARGFVSGAAEILGITPSAVYKAIQRHPSLRELQKLLVEDRRQPTLDMSEAKLMEAVWEGKSWAIKYYLNNQGAERGYGPRLAVKGKIEAEIAPRDPLYAYKSMPPERRRRRIAELLQRAKELEEM